MKRINKRGTVTDAVFIGIFLVVLAIVAYPLANAFMVINVDIQASDTISDKAKGISEDNITNLPAMFDGLYFVILILGYAAVFILSFQINTNPAFFIAAALLFTTTILVIPFLANVFDDFTGGTGATTFALAGPQFTVIPFVMQHYLQITIVSWVTVAFALYARRQLV